MRDSVSIEAVQAAARANNRPGPDHMNCGESVIAALWDAFEPDFPRSVVAMGAGMGAGIGGSGLHLRRARGRRGVSRPHGGHQGRAKPLAAELHDAFRDGTAKHVTCCRVLTRGMDWWGEERVSQCQDHCALAACAAAQILCRELGVRLQRHPRRGNARGGRRDNDVITRVLDG